MTEQLTTGQKQEKREKLCCPIPVPLPKPQDKCTTPPTLLLPPSYVVTANDLDILGTSEAI